MTNHRIKRIRSAITSVELDEHLKEVFESHQGKGYLYMDHDHGQPMRETAYDRLLLYFDDNQREIIEAQIQRTMSQSGTHRIMDQGCGHANSLSAMTRRFSKKYPENEYHGYGVSASLEDMWLGHRTWEDDMTPQQEELLKDHEIYSFESWNDQPEKVSFFGIEDDLHNVMERFPFPLDLVFSDHTYFHLLLPWLALKRTADKLAVGGVAMIRTAFTYKVSSDSGRQMSERSLVKLLQRDNLDYNIISPTSFGMHRVLAIIKNKETKFRTNQYVALVDDYAVESFYSRKPQPADFLAIDHL